MNIEKIIVLEKLIVDPNVLNIYVFGSHMYGTTDEQSDTDYICVLKEYVESDNINIHHYTVAQFQNMLNNCDIQMLECYFADKQFILKEEHKFTFTLNRANLRSSISTIASNSWVKGKKKLIVTGDYDLRLAIKSIFHSMRILNYGIQVATEGRIVNYGAMNYVLADIWKMSETYQRMELWNAIDQKYRSSFNHMSSDFKKLAPKDLSETDRRIKLIKLLQLHGITAPVAGELADEIMELFTK